MQSRQYNKYCVRFHCPMFFIIRTDSLANALDENTNKLFENIQRKLPVMGNYVHHVVCTVLCGTVYVKLACCLAHVVHIFRPMIIWSPHLLFTTYMIMSMCLHFGNIALEMWKNIYRVKYSHVYQLHICTTPIFGSNTDSWSQSNVIWSRSF